MIVRALLQPGADPSTEPAADINAPYGYDLTTPLYAACKNAHHGVVSILLQNRPPADINKSGRDGATPLDCGAQHGHDVVVRLLLRFGADVDKRAKDGRTPLHAAAVGGHEPVVRRCFATARTPTPWMRKGGRRCTRRGARKHRHDEGTRRGWCEPGRERWIGGYALGDWVARGRERAHRGRRGRE